MDNETFVGAKVLIVDDAPVNLDLLRSLLEPKGCQIFFATTGEMALEIAPGSQPDIILMDVMMPDMDGFETCSRLKRLEWLSDVPVIFITAKTDVADLARGFEVGGADYITKPVKQQEVHSRVGAHLKIKRLIEQQKKHVLELEVAKQELQELNATKDRFLSNIGHDLQASLAEIYRASAEINTTASKTGGDTEESNKRLEAINKTSENLLRVLENVLEWPRVQSGQKLDLFNTEITDDDLGFLLQSLDHLRFLSLANTKISDTGLLHLKPLKFLQELHLDNTAVSNGGLALLGSLPSLRVLDLKNTRIGDEGLALLKPLSGMRSLFLTQTDITDVGLVHLQAFGNLESLSLWGTPISDEGLIHLRGLSKLRELILWGTRVTEEGGNSLRKVLPECDISTTMLG